MTHLEKTNTGNEIYINYKERVTRNFFQELLRERPISSIYYPGSGNNFILDEFFKPHQITYLDRMPARKYVKQGDFGLTPDIPDGLFDALFLQDIHQTRRQMFELTRVIKEQGVVIQSLYRCGMESKDSLTPDQVAEFPGLEEVHLVSPTHPFRTFVKIQ